MLYRIRNLPRQPLGVQGDVFTWHGCGEGVSICASCVRVPAFKSITHSSRVRRSCDGRFVIGSNRGNTSPRKGDMVRVVQIIPMDLQGAGDGHGGKCQLSVFIANRYGRVDVARSIGRRHRDMIAVDLDGGVGGGDL